MAYRSLHQEQICEANNSLFNIYVCIYILYIYIQWLDIYIYKSPKLYLLCKFYTYVCVALGVHRKNLPPKNVHFHVAYLPRFAFPVCKDLMSS